MTEGQPTNFKITVEYQSSNRAGRWGKVYHIFDMEGGEVKLHQKEALKMAKAIIKIVREK